MKICIVGHEYAPFPHGGIATYHNAAARALADAGHEVHVVTNRAAYGQTEPELTARLWKRGNLTVHRLDHFDEQRAPVPWAPFFDTRPREFAGPDRLWASESSNLAAHNVAAYVEDLHRLVGLDVIEAPEFFAEAFYVIRRRLSGWRDGFPPVCIHGHVSSRIAFGANRHVWELGLTAHRHMMQREEYCITHADALVTPSRALMERYEELSDGHLPDLREVIPYFLDVPREIGTLPAGLSESDRFLVCLGRFEPRKGADVALRAFADLADDDPDLRLVFIGKEMWHHGESVDDVVAALVPERHRGRIVRLGGVPRAQAMAVVRSAVAFLHPSPWDNYPCAVLEAMAVGATCVVSDSGGQAEMIEQGRSGVVVPAGDPAALAAAVRELVRDPDRRRALGAAAATRVGELTEPSALVARRVKLFEAMVAREAELPAPPHGAFAVPDVLRLDDELLPLPGRGIVMLDAGGASAEQIATSRATLIAELATTPDWDVVVLADVGQAVEVPESWTRTTTFDAPRWLDSNADDHVVYLRAGVSLDRGRLRHIVAQVHDSPLPCASFGWLRPEPSDAFPYGADFSALDLLHAGHPLPAVFAARAEHLARCDNLSGLTTPEHRQCALAAAIAATGRMSFRHVGEVCGDYAGPLPFANADAQQRAIGYLDQLGLLPRDAVTFDRVDGVFAGGSSRDEELERIYREHMALKQMRVVRWLRKLRLFDLARFVFPKSKSMIGSGNER